ncbi:MAG: SDR family oxidoreductase [Myxococcales bacterium]|nr:SDR family oxidoreductase [Myxococcales bacterium]MDH3484375.1 SDR family oxidoreductase [Myxococcales bacterium]
MSLLSLFKGKGPNGFGYGSTAEEVTEGIDLSGRTMLLTGCNSGIGLETLRVLTKRGAHVIAAARTVEKARAAGDQVGGGITAVACDLAEPATVLDCVQQVKATGRPLDAIICNAGIMALPKLKQKYGYELQFFTNHIGHFMLVTSLVDNLANNGRVVIVSSEAHHQAPAEGIQFDNLSGERGYTPFGSYGQSKLANLLFANQLAKRLVGTGKTANSLHPGVIHTNLTRNMNPIVEVAMGIGAALVLKSIPEGAATQCYAATHPGMQGVSGKYLADCNESRPGRHGRDPAMAEKLWEVSERIVAEVTA